MSSSSSAINVMLEVQEKKTIHTDLRNYITRNYSERPAHSVERDLRKVRSLRRELESSSDPSLELRRDLLISYFKSLSIIESRFPSLSSPSSSSSSSSSLSFTWHDSFKPKFKITLPSIHLEKAAVLFNLAAVYSKIAVSVDRTSKEGMENASSAFQWAAGSFGFLKAALSDKLAAAGGGTVDVGTECAGMLERLMLAQAQECLFEKIIGDEKLREGKSRQQFCIKVASQVGLYYEETYAALNSEPLNQHFDRSWISHVQLKAAQFYAEACYRYSLELHENDKIVEEIARINIGLSALANARKSAKGVVAPLMDAVTKLESNMNIILESANTSNALFVLESIPPACSLPPLPAASLVKPIPMAEVLDAGKERLFTDIVPDTRAKAFIRYNQLVDEIIRIDADQLKQQTKTTGVKLKEMDLPYSIMALEGNFSLPMDLMEDVEAVQISGGPSGLEAELQQLKHLRRVYQELHVQTEDLLQKEADRDAELCSKFGIQWTRPQPRTLTKDLQDRLNRFAAKLKQATDSDARIERALKGNSVIMAILDHRPIESALPSLARPIMSLDSNRGDAIVGTLKESLRQLENLGAQGAGLEDMFKETKRKDDILPKLMASTGDYNNLFKKETAKYDHIGREIENNIAAQQLLLLQIQAQNDEFAAAFNFEDYKVSREKSYKQIAAAVAKYREIKGNINDGLNLFATLQDAMTNMRQQCGDLVWTRIQMPPLKFSASGRPGPSDGQPTQPRSPPPQQAADTQSAPRTILSRRQHKTTL